MSILARQNERAESNFMMKFPGPDKPVIVEITRAMDVHCPGILLLWKTQYKDCNQMIRTSGPIHLLKDSEKQSHIYNNKTHFIFLIPTTN